MTLTHALASESLLLRSRSALYAVGGLWLAMVLAFTFGIPYIVYKSLDEGAAERQALLDILLPSAVDITSVSTYPLFGGAMMLILGVFHSGSEYRWGTWKARFTQGPTRSQVLIAKFVAGAAGVVAICAAALLVSVALSSLVALLERAPVDWPTPSRLLLALGAAALISATWFAVGLALGVVTRGTSVALIAGLLWTLAFENVVAALTTLVPVLEPIRYVLLGSASGSLVHSLGGRSLSEGGSPGVVDVLSGPAAAGVLGFYLVLSVAVSVVLLQRRDVT